MSDRTFPAPSTISEQAQQRLAVPLEERSYPASDDTAAWLAMAEHANHFTSQHFASYEASVGVDDLDVNGATVYAARPTGASDERDAPLYLWLHPGAFLVGGGAACRATTSRTAVNMHMLTWGVDYGVPPLRPFPAALDDAVAAYRGALAVRDPSRIFVGGDSSGGNLAAGLLLRVKDEGLPMPAALVLNTPAIDLTESGDTFRTLDGVDNALRSTHEVHALYAAGADLSSPYLSPLFGDVSGFPPTFVQSGTRDLFLSNAVRMHRALRAAGVAAELHVFEAMPHGGFGGDTPEDLDHVAEQRRFLRANGA